MLKKINNYIKLMRPKHYIKNLLIFIPLFFSGRLFELNLMVACCLSFISFSLIASSIYVINDLKDVEKDKLHIKKCKRPIASGAIEKSKARMFAILLFVLSILINFAANKIDKSVVKTLYVLVGYFALNIAYTFKLKHVPIADVASLSASYFIRVYYGSVITGIAISDWLYLSIISAAFFLGLGKRRNEMKHMTKDIETRSVLQHYTESFLTNNMYVFLCLGIVFYSLWSMTTGLLATVPILIMILMKYSLMIETTADGDPVDTMLSDKVFIALIVIFAIILSWAVYMK